MPLPDGTLAQPLPGLFPVRDAREPIRCLIASLAPGGAERIVLDWLGAEARMGRDVQLAVLHRRQSCLPPPPGVRVLARGSEPAHRFIALLADRWRDARAPVAAHLVPDGLIDALCAAGLRVVPVVHNVREGWRNDPARWTSPSVPLAVACAGVVRAQMQEAGCRVPLVTVRHRPRVGARASDPALRRALREAWGVGEATLLVGMVGAIKAQKDYARAVDVLALLRQRRDAVLAIVGGLLDRAALGEFDRLLESAIARGVQRHIRLPGFTGDIEPWLAAFDVLLNTSRHEGLSIAVQEALDAGLPVVATDVGGQRELIHASLRLVAADASPAVFAGHLAGLPVRGTLRPGRQPSAPRVWSLTLTNRPPSGAPIETLFTTANLNAGGAQRSLVNLVGALAGRHRFAVAVCGPSTQRAFADSLTAAGIEVFQASALRDDLAQAESLLAHAAARAARNLCFWNVAPGVKLAAQRFAPPDLRVIDVSPGGHAFEEMQAAREFADAIGTSSGAYHGGLHALVLKWRDPAPPPSARIVVIANGVAAGRAVRGVPEHPRFLVSGRIAPSKRLERVLDAFSRFQAMQPAGELHLFGSAEPRHRDHADRLAAMAGPGVRFRGACFDGSYFCEPWTAAIVLGTHQGCPNAVLEAFAAGVPVIANDSGGTRELLESSGGGWLLCDAVDAGTLAAAMTAAWGDARDAAARGRAARQWVEQHCTLQTMAQRYLDLLA